MHGVLAGNNALEPGNSDLPFWRQGTVGNPVWFMDMWNMHYLNQPFCCGAYKKLLQGSSHPTAIFTLSTGSCHSQPVITIDATSATFRDLDGVDINVIKLLNTCQITCAHAHKILWICRRIIRTGPKKRVTKRLQSNSGAPNHGKMRVDLTQILRIEIILTRQLTLSNITYNKASFHKQTVITYCFWDYFSSRNFFRAGVFQPPTQRDLHSGTQLYLKSRVDSLKRREEKEAWVRQQAASRMPLAETLHHKTNFEEVRTDRAGVQCCYIRLYTRHH